MCNKAQRWVYSLDLPHTTKSVLIALAYHADSKRLECWPSQETLAKEVGITSRSVREQVKKLVTEGLVKMVRRRLPTGLWAVAVYRLAMPKVYRNALPEDEAEYVPGDCAQAVESMQVSRNPAEPDSAPTLHRNITANPPEPGACYYIHEQSLKTTKHATVETAFEKPIQTQVKSSFSEGDITPIQAASPQSAPPVRKEVGFDPEKRRFTGIPDSLFAFWEKAFPHLDVDRKLTELEAWALANPAKLDRQRKRKGLQAFLVDCLALANERFAVLKAGLIGKGQPLPSAGRPYPFACA